MESDRIDKSWERRKFAMELLLNYQIPSLQRLRLEKFTSQMKKYKKNDGPVHNLCGGIKGTT